MLPRRHGGGAPPGAVDYSSPSNPKPPRRLVESLLAEAVRERIYERYPEPSYSRLRSLLAEAYGVEEEDIVVLNGAAEAYSLLPLALRPRSIVVLAPSFGDHLHASLASHTPLYMLHYREEGRRYRLPLEALEELPERVTRGSLVLLSNPNNPTGACLSRSELEAVAEAFKGSLVVVDESFQPLSWSCPSIIRDPPEGTVVLLSLTKMLGVQGLRIGILIDPWGGAAEALELARQPWNVNSLSAYLLEKLLEGHWGEVEVSLREARLYAEKEAERLAGMLGELGCRVYETTAPYMLVRHVKMHPELNKMLAERGVWVRDCTGYQPLTPLHSRISILGDPRLNDRLVEAFEEVGACR